MNYVCSTCLVFVLSCHLNTSCRISLDYSLGSSNSCAVDINGLNYDFLGPILLGIYESAVLDLITNIKTGVVSTENPLTARSES